MTLYEINQEILNCISIDEDTGEAFVDEEKLAALQMEADQKIENTLCWVKDLEAEQVALKAERDNIDHRMKVNSNRIASLKHYASDALCGKKFKTARCTASYRTSESVEVNEELLPKKYFTKKVTTAPDKIGIKALLKAGKKIKGASLVKKTSIVIK